MRELLRRYRWTFLLGSLAAIALRLLFILRFANINGDSLIYADIANNWLHHGLFALTENGIPVPTLIRVPGYPAFVAAIFAVFHTASMTPILYVQMFVDLATCFVIAALAWELFTSAAIARLAFVLAAICPFTANYVALPLTETLAIFFTALAILLAVKGARAIEERQRLWAFWVGCGLATAAGILLRPDGGLLLVAIGVWLVSKSVSRVDRRYFAAALIVGFIAVAPLAPWAVRNWRIFQVFQPLAPRYANAPDEYVAAGFNRWVKTWIAEYVSVEDVYWKVSTETPGESIDITSLPLRAFDSAEERERTAQLISEFDKTLMLTPETDAKFAELARERIARRPLRYYVSLPALRATDMWLRPRTEMLPIEPRWWTFDEERESWIAIAYGALNLLLLTAAMVGFVRFRGVRGYGLLLGFVLLRTVFFSSIENPEPRYMLECFPVILVMGATAFHSLYEKLREGFGSRELRKIAA